jgi:hypothetical protein
MTTSEAVSELLADIADALNQLEELGEHVRIKYDAVMTDHGYVWTDSDGVWRTKLKTGEIPAWRGSSASLVDNDD